MEKAHRMIAGSLLLGGLVACEPVEPTAGVSMDARGVRGGVGASSGPVRADVGTGGAAVRARSGPVSVGMGTSGARAGIDVLDDEPLDLSFGLSSGGVSASLGLDDMPFKVRIGPGGVGLGF